MRGAIRLILTAVLLTAFWLRVHQLEQFPPGLHFDEAANGILSSEIAFEGYRPIFISSYTGKESFFFYAAGLLMSQIGSSIFALRLTAGFLGLLTIAGTYQLGARLLRDRRTATIAAILITVNFSHLLFSRLGFRAISQPFCQLFAVLFLIDGLRRLERNQPAWWSFGGAGLFLGLTAHTYLAARLFPVALAIPLLILLWGWRKRAALAQLFTGLGFMGLVGATVLAPLLFWFFQNPEAFWVRIDQVGASESGITVLEGLRRTAAMLFWNGDPYIRFNIPGRPLFFPLAAIAAVLGIWQLLKQLSQRDLHDQFGRWVLFMAPIVMLLPTALATSEIVPSNLRAIGIFPFIVFWPAVGMMWLFDFGMARLYRNTDFEAPAWAFIPLVIPLLFLSADNVQRDYFQQWGEREDSFYETEGELRELATYLNGLETDRTIFISTRFVPHPSLAFLADGYDRFRLVPESRALVYPAGALPFYFFPASSPEPAWMGRVAAEREPFASYSGIPTFDQVAYTNSFPEPDEMLYGNFGYAIELQGIDFEQAQTDQTAKLRTYSTVLGNPGFNMVPFVHIEDHMGNRWVQSEQPGYSPADWQPGDRFVQQFEIPIPAGLPPTAGYTVRMGWFDADTGQEVTRFDEDGQFAGSALLIKNVRLTDQPSDPVTISDVAAQTLFNQQVVAGLFLNGLDLPRRTFNQGDQIDFALHWMADRPLPDMVLQTELVNADGVVVLASGHPAGNSYPFGEWQPPAYVLDRQRVRIPADLPAGEWAFQTVAVLDSSEQIPLFDPITLTIEPLDLILEKPAVESELNEIFEGEIELVGQTFRSDIGELELVWRGVAPAAGDYVAFVQLQNADGSCCVWQSDRPLVSSAARPTSRWVAGEYLVDRYVINVEGYGDGLPLVAGLYRPENGSRLLTADKIDQVKLR